MVAVFVVMEEKYFTEVRATRVESKKEANEIAKEIGEDRLGFSQPLSNFENRIQNGPDSRFTVDDFDGDGTCVDATLRCQLFTEEELSEEMETGWQFFSDEIGW